MELIEHESGGGCFIPKSYRFYKDTGKSVKSKYREDAYWTSALPHATWDSETSMYELTFAAPDFGGYDVCTLEFYFRTWGELTRWLMNQLEREECPLE